LKAVLIRNPISGNPDRQYALDLAMAEFVRAGWVVEERQTAYKGHARELASQAVDEGYREIIVAGGDGSIGQVCDGIVRSGAEDVRLGIIPLGTGNVFARDVGLPFPKSPNDQATVQAAQIILSGETIAVDIGLANGSAFICWAGCGIDAAVSDRVENYLTFDKRHSPVKTYVLEILKLFRTYDPQWLQITVDGQETIAGRFYLVVASNIALYARYLRLAPRAYLNDGYLDLLVLDAEQLLRFIYLALKAVAYPVARDRHIVRQRFRSLQVETEAPLIYHLDGDPIGEFPLQIEVLPRRLPVYLDSYRTRARLYGA